MPTRRQPEELHRRKSDLIESTSSGCCSRPGALAAGACGHGVVLGGRRPRVMGRDCHVRFPDGAVAFPRRLRDRDATHRPFRSLAPADLAQRGLDGGGQSRRVRLPAPARVANRAVSLAVLPVLRESGR
jgi:hypothetical protein